MRGRPVPSPEEIEASAEDFRRRYAPDTVGPLAIDKIVEFKLKIDIVPVRRICRRTRSKAWLCNGGTTIVVDKCIFLEQPAEYRQVIAHETAHFVRHRDVMPERPFSSIEDCRLFHDGMSQELVAALEWEATEWAGRVLMPRRQLETVVISTARDFQWVYDAFGREGSPIAHQLIIDEVAERFGVLPTVAERRIRGDGLFCYFTPARARAPLTV